MPIAPRDPFFKFTCETCGWSLVTYHTSDAIHHPYACPKCGSTQLDLSKAGAMESLRAFPMKFFNNWLLNK